ncbi:MAG: XRE family transcriptional regulator [Lachnospiraceae bacterium]|nr:XRE family transcriptional regulator [Lachnospiraceae bacterium]
MGDVYMSAKEVIKAILEDKHVTQVELAEKTNVTKQNFNNKMNRDNFSTLELVEIADALEMQLILKNTSDGKEYIIDYPEEQKGKPKRGKKAEE